MRRRRPVTGCVAMAVAAAAALSACGGLPTDSAVQQGSLVGEAALQPVRVQPDGPAAGATPEQIVRGFLRAGAGAGFDDDHATARSFFTRGVKDQWLPGSGVVVYDDDASLKVELLNPSTVRVSAVVVAELDSLGRYHETPAGTVARATFGLEKLGVGWRISKPPKGFGSWLSASDLDRIYRSFTIAYVSRVAPRIVGDPRWFPVTAGLPTTLARAQLAPVPGYLSGAVQTGVPRGTTLGVDSVPIQSGRAVVDLSTTALLATPNLRRAMWAQFVTTLMQVVSVAEVSLEVDGAGLELPDTPDGVSAPSMLGYQVDDSVSVSTGVLRRGTDLSRVSSDRPLDQDQPPKTPRPPASPVLPKVSTGWVSLALSWNGQEIAGIGSDRQRLARWQGGRSFQRSGLGTGLTRPSYDSLNGLWVAGQAGGTAKVWVINTSVSPMQSARPRAISAPWLANRVVLALKVATDNERVAVISSNLAGGDVRVVVAGVVRSAAGVPISLAADPLRVGWTLSSASDVVWVDDNTLALVGRVGRNEAIGPLLVEIGGKVTVMAPVTGTRLVTTTGGPRGIVVMTDRGQVLARVGNGWQLLQKGTDFLIPGK